MRSWPPSRFRLSRSRCPETRSPALNRIPNHTYTRLDCLVSIFAAASRSRIRQRVWPPPPPLARLRLVYPTTFRSIRMSRRCFCPPFLTFPSPPSPLFVLPTYVPLDSDVATVLLPTLAHVHLSDLSALVADQRR